MFKKKLMWHKIKGKRNTMKKYFKNSIEKRWISKTIVLFTPMWGEAPAEFLAYTLPSIKESIERLQEEYEVIHDIYTTEQSRSFVTNFVKIPNVKRRITNIKGEKKERLLSVLKENIKYCLSKKAVSILVSPDTIIGKESLYNIVKVFEIEYKSIFAYYAPIKDKPELKGKSPTNAELVEKVFEDPHPIIEEGLKTHDRNASIRIVKHDDFYLVKQPMPAPVLFWFEPEDLDFFTYIGVYNDIDRGWADFLLQKKRIKYVLTSDVYFCVEKREEGLVDGGWTKDYCRFDKLNLNNHLASSCYAVWKGNIKFDKAIKYLRQNYGCHGG